MSYPKFDPTVDYTKSSIKQHIIERVKIEFGKFLPLYTPLDIDVYERINNDVDGFACHVKMHLFGKQLDDQNEYKKDTVDFEIPKTWWDHFKLECFPKWLLKYFPVHYHKLHTEVHNTWIKKVTNICPHVSSKDERKHLNWVFSGLTQTEYMPTKCSRCGNIMNLHDSFSTFSVYHCLNCNAYEKVDK